MRILSISHSIPQKNAPHAGGNTYALYMKQIADDNDMQLDIIAMCSPGDEHKADFDYFKAHGEVILSKGGLLRNINRIIWDSYGRLLGKDVLNSYYKQKQYIKRLKNKKRNGYTPDVIILEWAQCVTLADECKKIFPNAKLLASEHDVMYLGVERKVQLVKGSFLKRKWALHRAAKAKKEELKKLMLCDIIMPHNPKDGKLLLENGIPSNKIHTIVPFFHNYCHTSRSDIRNDVIFWGAMGRIENEDAVIWFINNVMNRLDDTDVKFIVVGNKPSKKLLGYASDRIIITGYVETPEEYFEHALCLVSPLRMGAGIKIKIVEALSAGIPVLTNSIGIEGIRAADGISFYNCETGKDYERIIRHLIKCKDDLSKMMQREKDLINRDFDLEASKREYIAMIKNCLQTM